ncbi:uncharacterized protein MONOS_18275 [Monocercomonoides exilis]|uniref:uncharacterized protein n=1 Tax=Monocercomonoides exilis TaxID=2049356 RepID=UPI003559ACB8|nr:hypothetical protein MONOS_18275 [Monocercomonoides exilis]
MKNDYQCFHILSTQLKDGWNLLSDVREASFTDGVDERKKKERQDWSVCGVFEKERWKKWKKAMDAKREAVLFPLKEMQREGKIVMTLVTVAFMQVYVLVLVSEKRKDNVAADVA